jgi:hypothetical protein
MPGGVSGLEGGPDNAGESAQSGAPVGGLNGEHSRPAPADDGDIRLPVLRRLSLLLTIPCHSSQRRRR